MYILHSGSSLLWIQDVHHFSQRDTLSLKFKPVLLPMSATNFTKIASFRCQAASSCDSGSSSTEEAQRTQSIATLQACLASPVVQGYFRLDPAAAQFHMETHKNASGVWSMWYFNLFDRRIVFNNAFVSRETKHIVKILNFTGPLSLPPGCWNMFSLKLAVKDIALNIFTNVFLTTNIGAIFAIPLQIHSAPTKEGSLGFEVIAHCGMHYFMGRSQTETPDWQRSLSLDRSTWDVDFELANKLYERWKKLKSGDTCKRNVLGMTRFAHSKKSKESESFLSFLPRLITEPSLVLNFSATALRNSAVKYFVVKNPSSRPISLQLLPVSLYPTPEAALRLLHKWFGIDTQTINLTTGEFQLTQACPPWGMRSEETRLGILHLRLQPLERRRVGVGFTPADYGRVASLILIRNNLTIIDVVRVEGLGARELLRVGGRLPGAGGSLRFKVPESTLMDCRRQLKDSKHILSITKNFKVENIGPLPVIVASLKINGYNCQGYGFEVLDCHPFSLDPNSSRDISIVFTPDFTSSWVIRELTLVTAAHLEFHFTLNVTLPHHLLPLCADVVPGPSWEESFWRLTVFFVSLSLMGVILIAFQQAQCILMEFMKTKQRQNSSPSSQQSSSPMDAVSPLSHKSNCKNFLDVYGPSDKGRGRSCLPVTTPQSRIQNAAKRSPATYGHSQKKHKCSVYYSKHKASAPPASSASTTTEERQTSTPGSSPSAVKEDVCTDGTAENRMTLKYTSGVSASLQKNLALPQTLLPKEETPLKSTVVASNASSQCSVKEGAQTCMFPKETDIKTSETGAELKQRELCPLKTPKKLPEHHLPRSSTQHHSDLPEIPRTNNGSSQQVPVKPEADHCELLRKPSGTKASSEKQAHRASKDEVCPEKQDVPSAEQEDPSRKKKLQENKGGNTHSLNWNKNRTCRKNKKKGVTPTSRSPEHGELKLVCREFERPEPSGAVAISSWCVPESPGETGRATAERGSGPAAPGEAEGYYRQPEKKCVEKFCSDSSSDCGSSSGSVRASRGSWGSWSSTSSSSDGDKKPASAPQHFLPAGDGVSQNGFPSEAPVSFNLSQNICSAGDANPLPQYAEAPCPSLPPADVPLGVDGDKGLYAPGDLWPTQPVCLTSRPSCNLESSVHCGMREPAPAHDSSFVDWGTTCDGPFPTVYCPLELNDYNAFPEENMNFPNGFSCPAEVQTDFIDHTSQSTWSAPANMPAAWGHASFISSPPYLTSTRSLSPMSGLFGSIWAPQNDVYENCCPISPTTEHSTHMENQAVMCKEYYPGFNPFRASMDLDIWATTANRNTSFPLARDPSYCGNV